MDTGAKIAFGILVPTALIGLIVIIKKRNAAAAVAAIPQTAPPVVHVIKDNWKMPILTPVPSMPPAPTTGTAFVPAPVNPSDSFSFAWADSNDFPIAANTIIQATTSNLANQQNLISQWQAAAASGDNNQMASVFYGAVENIFRQGMNVSNCKSGAANADSRIRAASGKSVSASPINDKNCSVATNYMINCYDAAKNQASVASENAKGINAKTLANNLVAAYNGMFVDRHMMLNPGMFGKIL